MNGVGIRSNRRVRIKPKDGSESSIVVEKRSSLVDEALIGWRRMFGQLSLNSFSQSGHGSRQRDASESMRRSGISGDKISESQIDMALLERFSGGFGRRSMIAVRSIHIEGG